MAVYVDAINIWPHARGRYRAGSCHLIADTVAELHSFAASCGFKRSWYHPVRKAPHYDLVASDREIAVRAGARELTRAEFVKALRAARGETTGRDSGPTTPTGGE